MSLAEIRTDFAVLWDMDGVLIDTGDLHYQTWQQVLSEKGVDFTHAHFRETFGMKGDQLIHRMIGSQMDSSTIRAIIDEKEERFRALMKGRVTLVPGVHAWLRRFANWEVRQAVASSAPAQNIEFLLAELGLSGYFTTMVSSDGLPGKPHPAIFLKAAESLNISRKKCIVIEDSIAGVSAAKAAKMICIAVTTTNSAKFLTEADLIIKDLSVLTKEDLFLVLQRGR
jgi:HAD superfamily hydrolase (TIGR01549 family)